jgi:hypothetical protein
MKSTKWILLAALIGAGQAWAQGPGEIHGKVVDDQGEPLEFVAVRAQQGETFAVGSTTDAEGRFILKPLQAGTYNITLQYMLSTQEITEVRVDPGLITRLNGVQLSTMLGVVKVEANKWEEPLIRVDDPARMVITTAQIEKNALRKEPIRMIANLTPGVTKSRTSDELYFRGSRAGSMAYYVDGVKVASTNPGVSSDAISRVSVYTGGLPAKYGDVTGGVVAIETKSYFELYQQRNR